MEISLAETDEIKIQNAKLIQSLGLNDDNSRSPINLDISYMKVIELNPLEWNGIDIAPRKLKITNTGYTVIISAKWQERHPYISNGPLPGNYTISQIHFHWGENEMIGSEHTVDGARMPMELHAVHFKDEYDSLDVALRRPDGAIVLVYFFKLQDGPNEFMEEIVKNLNSIQEAHSSARLVPKFLTEILRPFKEDYFLYWGPIVTAENVHRILWLICREPIGITSKQIAEFRTLHNERNVPILSNIRPLQEVKEENVFHVCPSGSTYASLLPLPRDVVAKQTDETD
ncbi:carbonic anhydrase 1-like [Osmia bicornis bicornis]|uniref:carbonic anhydrase 1-like n=1 Tax=Osmia bicornis bicornis TaxID=1437191 RepID=UPI001EAEA4F7|nr:carbonic anhydrase 1-like [Osmia bicornis bicornis]